MRNREILLIFIPYLLTGAFYFRAVVYFGGDNFVRGFTSQAGAVVE